MDEATRIKKLDEKMELRLEKVNEVLQKYRNGEISEEEYYVATATENEHLQKLAWEHPEYTKVYSFGVDPKTMRIIGNVEQLMSYAAIILADFIGSYAEEKLTTQSWNEFAYNEVKMKNLSSLVKEIMHIDDKAQAEMMEHLGS